MSRSKTAKSTQKKTSNNRYVSLVRSHKLLVVLVVFAVGIIGFFGYNKYLDHTNVQDMKQLLAAFEELRTDIKNTTGQDVEIKANCGSVGKFSTSYACSLYAQNKSSETIEYTSLTRDNKIFDNTLNQCRVISSQDANMYGSYSCVMSVRMSNIPSAESIFYQYDTSPGRPR